MAGKKSAVFEPLEPGRASTLLRDVHKRGESLATAALTHEDFQDWHDEALHVIAQAFGPDSTRVESFRKIAEYGGPLVYYAQPGELQRNRESAMRQSLKAVEAAIRCLPPSEDQGGTRMNLPQQASTNGIFLSHASADKKSVTQFVENVLEGGIGVDHNHIFCISVSGQGVPPGKHFVPYIREQIQSRRIFIPWISQNFWESPFCMAELGAGWVLREEGFLPVLVNLDFDRASGVLLGTQVLQAHVANDLSQLRDEIRKRMDVSPRTTATWEDRRNQFLRDVFGKKAQ